MLHLEGKGFLLTGRFPGTTQAALRARIEAAGGFVVDRGGVAIATDLPEFAVIGSNPSAERLAEVAGVAQHITLSELEAMLLPSAATDGEALARGLISLGIEDGDETVLDLSTGAQYDRLPLRLTDLPALASEELTLDTLEQALAAAQLKVTRLSDSDLEVEIYDDSALLRIDAARRWLRFQKSFTINAYVSDAVKHGVVNGLNAEWDVVRFYIAAPDTLAADWVIPYHQGIAPFQIVLAVQGFVATVQEALRSCADAGLLA